MSNICRRGLFGALFGMAATAASGAPRPSPSNSLTVTVKVRDEHVRAAVAEAIAEKAREAEEMRRIIASNLVDDARRLIDVGVISPAEVRTLVSSSPELPFAEEEVDS